MDKPEDIAREYFDWLSECWPSTASKLPDAAKDRLARAILSAQSQAYIDAARVAEDWEPVEKLLPFADDSHNEAAHTGQYEAGERISAAILQRKEEIGRETERIQSKVEG